VKFLFLFCLSIALHFSSCKDKPNKIQVLSGSNLTDKEAIEQIVTEIYKDKLKSFKLEEIEPEKWKLTIDFGGTTALTFIPKDKYNEFMENLVALYLLKTFKNCSSRNLQEVRIALVKPFYVSDPSLPSESIEEFEIFRTRLSITELNKVTGWNHIDEFSESKKGEPSLQVIEILQEIRKVWIIELNELKRIEIK
jgi:hypothetical protein